MEEDFGSMVLAYARERMNLMVVETFQMVGLDMVKEGKFYTSLSEREKILAILDSIESGVISSVHIDAFEAAMLIRLYNASHRSN